MTNIDLLYTQLYRPLCLFALHYLDETEAAEDVVQDCFIKYWENCNQDNQPSPTTHHLSPKSLLYTMVRNRCIDQLRRQKGIDLVQPADADGVISDEEAEARSLHEAELWTAIDSLPTRCRQIFLMSKRDGMTYRAIATTLNLSEKTVEHQISKALRVLRGKSGEYFYLLTF